MSAVRPDPSRPTRLARVLTEELTAEASELDARWAAAVRAQFGPPDGDRLVVLRGFAAQADIDLGMADSARRLWAAAGIPDVPAEVAAAVRVFERVGFKARKIEEHRTRPWVPRDPERLAEGIRQAREGKAIPAEEIRDLFRRRARGEGG